MKHKPVQNVQRVVISFFCDFFLSPKEKTGVAINIEQQPLTG